MQTRLTMIRAGLLSFICVVTAHAQAPATQTSSAAGEKITLRGCVERADQLGGAATTAQATDPDSMSFVLIHAERGSAASSRPQPVGTSGSANDTMKGDTYRLDGAVPTLNPHVGHAVEVTGIVAAAAPSTRPDDANAPLASAPQVKVDEIRMVSETCPR